MSSGMRDALDREAEERVVRENPEPRPDPNTLSSSLATLPETFDPVNRPKHYNSDPSGVECITITEHRNFCVGNAIKYLWRAGLKGDANDASKHIEDLKKARWYIDREIQRLERSKP